VSSAGCAFITTTLPAHPTDTVAPLTSIVAQRVYFCAGPRGTFAADVPRHSAPADAYRSLHVCRIHREDNAAWGRYTADLRDFVFPLISMNIQHHYLRLTLPCILLAEGVGLAAKRVVQTTCRDLCLRGVTQIRTIAKIRLAAILFAYRRALPLPATPRAPNYRHAHLRCRQPHGDQRVEYATVTKAARTGSRRFVVDRGNMDYFVLYHPRAVLHYTHLPRLHGGYGL